MKLISFAIPSYNSQDYLCHCVDTILTGGEDVEILIINDGSTDNTAAIADEYAAKYPSIVRAIHKENGGHGSAVNRGRDEATGLYYKVVDSDDWVNADALKTLLDTIRTHMVENNLPDLYITNFTYDHVYDHTQFVRKWHRQFPANTFCTWDDVGLFVCSQVLLMHSLMYKTQRLRESDTQLPEHTFYVDNYFAYKPLPLMRTIFYLDVDLYNYFIGRDDQSVNIKNFTKRYDQQLRVMRCMADAYTYEEIRQMQPPLRRYMLHCLSAIMLNTMMFCCSGGDEPERIAAHEELWQHIQEQDPELYHFLVHRGMPAAMKWMPWKMRGKTMLAGYQMLCKLVKLG